MSDFWENYKSPLWQEKRLKIMQRARFSCERCFVDDKQLHVHHIFYERGKKPWEYEDCVLLCLCEACHKLLESAVVDIRLCFSELHAHKQELVHRILVCLVNCQRLGTIQQNDAVLEALENVYQTYVDLSYSHTDKEMSGR